MSNVIDYDLVEAVAATHISDAGFLYQASSRLYELDDRERWQLVSVNSLDILALNLKPIPPRPEPKPEPMEVTESFADFCERLFWEYDKELKKTDSSRMLFKEYLSKTANFKEEHTRPKPWHKYTEVGFCEPWEAARAVCDEVALYRFDGSRYHQIECQASAADSVLNGATLYTRKEIKRDWRDGVVFDGVYKCELTKNLIIDESFNKAGAIKLAKSILKAAGEDVSHV